jgi:hypothetical protein
VDRQRRAMRLTSAALTCAAAILVLCGGILFYSGHVLTSSAQFSQRATAALRSSHMRSIISARVTEQVIESEPDLVGFAPTIRTAVDSIAGSRPFQAIFEGAVHDLHRSVFGRGDDTFTMRLADLGVLIDAGLRTVAPSAAARIPPGTSPVLAKVSGGDFRQLSDVAQDLDDAHDLGVWLLLGGLVAFGLSILVAADRGRSLQRAGLALLVDGVAVVVAYTVARPLVLNRFDPGDARTAAGVIWDAFLADLRLWAVLAAAGGALLAASVAALRRPRETSLYVSVRAAIAEDTGSTATRAAVACGLIACGILVIVAADSLLRAAVVLAGACLVYVGLVRLLRLTLSLGIAGARRGSRRVSAWSRPGPRLVLLAPLVLLLAAAAFFSSEAAYSPARPPYAISDCNGYSQLCDRSLADVVFPSTHNSMGSSTVPGFSFPNQDGSIAEQLQDGIRGMLIDTHYGYKTAQGVVTDLSHGRGKLSSFDAIGPAQIAAAERIRARLGRPANGHRGVWLCHAFCEIGAVSAVQALGQMRTFLVEHPDQVLILSIEDDVSPQDTERVFRDSGLLDLVYQGPSGPPWPTLRQLIERDRRVIVFAENDTGGIRWYRPQFKLMEETPYRFTRAAQLAKSSSCRPNRGGTGKALFLLNNWVDTTPTPRPSNAAIVNAYPALLKRARECEAMRGTLPNLLAVDFYRVGDVFKVSATINGVGAR